MCPIIGMLIAVAACRHLVGALLSLTALGFLAILAVIVIVHLLFPLWARHATAVAPE